MRTMIFGQMSILFCVVFCLRSQEGLAASFSDLVVTEALLAEIPQQSDRFSKKKGSSSSIGTDAMDMRVQAAWFYGDQPIVTCFNRLSEFGASEEAARKAIEGAIQRWKDYFRVHRIVRARAEFSPNVNFRFIGKCKGDEHLVIYLGTGPVYANVLDLKAADKLNFPAAYANKTHMSRDFKWGKGYIRLVASGYYDKKPAFPDWSRPNALEGVLTHELGHVLGFLHTPGTLMEAEFADKAFAEKGLASLEIDDERMLVSCAECERTYRLVLPAAKEKFFQAAGFDELAKVRLLRTKSGFVLAHGDRRLKIEETSRNVMRAQRTLISLFDEPLNDTVESFNVFGFVSKPRKQAVLIESAGEVVLRALENDEIVEVGRFEKL